MKNPPHGGALLLWPRETHLIRSKFRKILDLPLVRTAGAPAPPLQRSTPLAAASACGGGGGGGGAGGGAGGAGGDVHDSLHCVRRGLRCPPTLDNLSTFGRLSRLFFVGVWGLAS